MTEIYFAIIIFFTIIGGVGGALIGRHTTDEKLGGSIIIGILIGIITACSLVNLG